MFTYRCTLFPASFGYDDTPQQSPSTKPTFRVKTSPPYSARKIGAPIQLPSIPSWPLPTSNNGSGGSNSSSGIQLPAIATLRKSSSPLASTGSTGLLPYRVSASTASGGESEADEEKEHESHGRETKWQLPSLSLPSLPTLATQNHQHATPATSFSSQEMAPAMTSGSTQSSSSFSASSQFRTYPSKNAQPIHAFDDFAHSPPSSASSHHHHTTYGSTPTATSTTSLPHLYTLSYLPSTTPTTTSSPTTSLSLPSLVSTPTSYSPPSDDGDWFFNTSSTPHLHPLQLHDFGGPPSTSSSSFSSASGGSGIGEREMGESDSSSPRLDTPPPHLHSHAFYRGPSMMGKNESEKGYFDTADVVRRRDSLVEIGSPAMGYLGYGY